eukprot:TRINITY_DN5203_c0_g1_i2.p2 TRINITY_DN5203_c0_g1~~TRINITY_DN5203_c0_g1_i2.p2  ORF type:complete len:261 (+),score=48.59 TRINITY_DN5203_c0_g1_i2:41-823(+)
MEDEVIHVAKISQQEQLMIDRLKQSAEQKEKDVADEEVVHVTKISMGERAMLERMAAEQEDEPTTPTVEVDTVSKPITQSPQVVQTQETKITQLKSWELERELVRDPRLLHTFVEALYYYHDSDIHKLLQGVADTVDKSFPEHKVTKKVKVTKIGGVVKTGPSQCLRPHRQHLQDQQASSQLTRLTTAFTRMDDTNKGFITPKQLVYCLDSDPTIRRLIAHSCFASPQLVLDLKQLVKTLPSQTRVYPKDLNSYITSLNR